MKQINLLLVSLLLAGLFSLNSCSKDETAAGPTIQLIAGGAGFLTGDGNIVLGDTVKVKFLVTKGDANLDVMTIFVNGNINPSWNSKDISGNDTYQGVFEWKPNAEGTYSIIIEATDKDDVLGQYIINVTVNSVSINSYSGKLLYVPDAAKNANVYFASSTGNTYSYNGVGANSGLVDWGYYYGTTAHHSFFALTQQPTLGYDITSWTKNATKFKLLNSVDFETTTTAAAIETACGTIGTNEKIDDLAINNVIGFKTAANKYGLIKITAISGNSNVEGTNITFSVKVQK